MTARSTRVLLYLAHALDHLALLIFATAVTAIAADFGFARWEDLMPYTTGAFIMFGLASLPAGHYGDVWGRRAMMLVFFFGMGASLLASGLAQSAWHLAITLTLLGVFSAIYHPVGIPMLIRHSAQVGTVLGINGFIGNLGIAFAALLTGFFVKYLGWRAAFIVPGLISIAMGLWFLRVTEPETVAPARRSSSQPALDRATAVRLLIVLLLTTTSASVIFNFTTNGNAELLRERLARITADPAHLGLALALVYALASLAQLVVGRMIDRFPLRRLFLPVLAGQALFFLLAADAEGWWFYLYAIAFMTFVFGAIPFTDAIIARHVDDRLRSRVTGVRLAVSFGLSSLAVAALGPLVKAEGFGFLLLLMAGIALISLLAAAFLPSQPQGQPAAAVARN